MKYLSCLLLLLGLCYPKKTWSEFIDPTSSLVTISSGKYDIFDHGEALFLMEYRSCYRFRHALFPLAGFMVTSKGATYFYAGFGIDIPFGKHFALTPTIAAGIYSKGNGKNLHYPLEFRSAIEAAYIFDSQVRIGIQLSHISNASLGKRNPGAEMLTLDFSFPL